MTIDSKLVERIAKLSRISLTETEIKNLSSELDNILNWIEQLSELDTEGINPVFSSFDEEETKYRNDKINDGGYREDIISKQMDSGRYRTDWAMRYNQFN